LQIKEYLKKKRASAMWQTFNCFHNGLLIYARGIKGGAHSKPEESSSVHFIKFRSIFESLEIAFSALSLRKKASRGKQKFKTRFAAALGMAHITNLNVSLPTQYASGVPAAGG
jgi:hypothetical protein